MKLLSSPTSPFVRKCRVVAHETGQSEALAIEFVTLTPVSPSEAVNEKNPVGKIPVLVLDDGSSLFDSRVVAEYLDARHSGKKLFPAEGPERWKGLRLQAIGDGIMDAGVALRFETTGRSERHRWDEFADKQRAKIIRALDVLHGEAASLGDDADIGTIAVACALGYLDFRFGGIIDWRDGRDELAAWYARFAGRESMRATEHKG